LVIVGRTSVGVISAHDVVTGEDVLLVEWPPPIGVGWEVFNAMVL
jgi:hypothetical protein